MPSERNIMHTDTPFVASIKSILVTKSKSLMVLPQMETYLESSCRVLFVKRVQERFK